VCLPSANEKAASADAASSCFSEVTTMSELTNDELKQNMAVLETFVTTALAIIIAMSGPDPGKKRAVKTLDAIKEASKRRLIEISSDMPVGEHYLDYLLSGLSENLGLLRPRDAQ
jgi:hypothetical protein